MSTSTASHTVQEALNFAKLGEIEAAFRKILLGDFLTPVDTADVTVNPAAAAVVLPSTGKAWIVESCEVAASGTAGSVGWYHVVPTGATEAVPAAAGKGGGVATISADGTTITFPNTVTQYRVRYIPQPAVALTTELTA